jgi:hypothetical protein
MRPADHIKDLFEQANIQADSEQTERILGDALNELKQRSASPAIRKRPSLWRLFMESKTTQLSTAAMVLLTLGLFFANINNTKVYAMSEIPALYQQVKTLHYQGTRYFPENNSSQSTPIEYWLDIENNRMRSLSPAYSVANGITTIYPTEENNDGNGIKMYISHTNKTVGYHRLSPFRQALGRHNQNRNYMRTLFGETSHYDAYQVIGQESINGTQYEIWEALITEHSSPTVKIKKWLNPSTGDLLKSKAWMLSEDDTWQLSSELSVIERNIEIPATIFSMTPPVGYTASNTPETAQDSPSRSATIGDGESTLTGYLLFSLPDGSLLAGWSSKYENKDEPQASLFTDLLPGGAFPQLPYQVLQLKAQMDEQEYVFSGCHLTSTRKEGQYYEWGLYIANANIRDQRLSLRNFLVDYKRIDGQKRNNNMWLQVDAVIETTHDFNDLVLAALSEFSDEGTAPTLSLKEVLTLAAQKRPN